ncbi:MAG: CinA family nicotinamide mononucleotide deamidase-related protein [Spirochaetes bacterium]|nr:CinA family nicotinamide mononucleotide deamidase-related protein [Spirochaetota bacterium]
MNACVLITGSELLNGQISDQNGVFLAKKFFSTNLRIGSIYIVRDDFGEIQHTLEEAIAKYDIVFITGGLGPTDDDVTCEVICKVCGKERVIDQPSLERMEKYFLSRGMSPNSTDRKMVLVPQGAVVLPNEIGFACGFILEISQCVLIALPGVPNEMAHMVENFVWPYLLKNGSLKEKRNLIVHTAFLRESEVNERIRSIISGNEIEWSICAQYGICEITFCEKSGFPFPSQTIREAMIKEFGPHLFFESSLEKAVLHRLQEKGLTLACAESCTGGLVSKKLTDVPGSSKVFLGTVVAYSNEAKIRLLNVSKKTLRDYGAVSEETACEMARGAKGALGSDVSLSITGIAGPEGGSTEKPVGTVCVGLAFLDEMRSRKELFFGDRERIRNFSATYALNFLRLFLLEL